MIEINIGASIESEGREIGRIERVILDRTSFEATHLVIRHGGAQPMPLAIRCTRREYSSPISL
ncbi:MAG: hypothetical protein IPO77_17585 [Acidobacteria bacterium]|nr:hypothetical protein [Acidobacteriota bacterium]